MEEKKLRIECNRRLLIQGCILTLLGLLCPAVVMEPRMGIYDTLRGALRADNELLLLYAAVRLVIMNVIRALPHYLGAFLINESLQVYIMKKRCFTINICLTMALILGVYNLIDYIYHIRYDFGLPALLIVCFVLFLSYMNLFSVSMMNKVILVASLLTSVQWLDICPGLLKFGVGRGEISMDIKNAAFIMEKNELLTLFVVCMFAVFLYSSLIQVQLLRKEHKLKISNTKTRKVEKELYETQMEALRMRNHSEAQSLVHDLKSPLTTIQGLITLADMMESNSLIREYFAKIMDSLSAMDVMISEILYENRKSVFTTEKLMQAVRAQVSILVPNEMLIYKNECPDAEIYGNRIRLARAMINLITNAYKAVDPETGKIEVSVRERGGYIYIVIKDNGIGMEEEQIEHIWELGYSETHSTGLGLAFTRQVIENHQGVIRVESEKGLYTKVTVGLKKGDTSDEYGKDSVGN